MATKLGKVLIYLEDLPLINLLDPSITWFCEVMRYIKYYISPLALDQWPPNIERW